MDVVIDEGGKQVIGRGNGVDIPGKMQVDLLHRQHLRIAAARSAALQAEYRPEGGLPQRNDGLFPQPAQRLRQPDGGSGFALPGGGGVDCRHEDQLAPGPALLLPQKLLGDLCLIAAVRLRRLGGDAGFFGDFGDGAQRGGLGDLDIGHHIQNLLGVLVHGESLQRGTARRAARRRRARRPEAAGFVRRTNRPAGRIPGCCTGPRREAKTGLLRDGACLFMLIIPTPPQDVTYFLRAG